MTKQSRNVRRLLQDFINIKLEGRLNHRELSFVLDEAWNYADSVDDYWPDDDVLVSFTPKSEVE
jgi:hypothetical protein